MVGKRMFWGVVLLAILTLAACIATFSALAGSFQGEVILLNFAMNVPMCIIIGYADYKLVALLHKRQKNTDALSIVANVVVSNLAIGSLFILYYLISRPARFDEPESLWQRLLPAILCNSIIVLIIEAFFYNNLFLANKARLAKVEQEKAKYQLENLKRQINPHFLFNMLNNANVLIKKNPEEASRVLFKLEDMLRYQINDSAKEQVLLSSEIHFLNDFLNLEKVRRDKFEYVISKEGDISEVWLPPLLFIPFVENTVKHNVDSENSSYVYLGFKVWDKQLEFQCINSKPKIALRKNEVGGLGLKNIKRRLELLFPERYTLEIEESEISYTVYLHLIL